MTAPLTIAVGVAALIVAMIAGYLHLPSTPDLEGERWFKVILATLLRGQVEARGGDAAAWETATVRFVPYHPAGRQPERKVTAPALFKLSADAIPGERALLETLEKLPDARARWARMYDTDPAGLDVRLGDPVDLGPAYDPGQVAGPGATWDDLAAWGADNQSFRETIERRVPAHWVLVRGTSPVVVDALKAEIGARASVVDGTDPATIAAACLAALPGAEDRLVVVVEGEAVQAALGALVDTPIARDRMLAFVSIGGVLGGRPGEEAASVDYVGGVFNHEHLDTESRRETPYLCLGWLDRAEDPPGGRGLPLQAQRFPEPGGRADISSIAVVDLGVLPVDPELPLALVARALWAVVVCEVLSRK
jgi:hypothetical protein